ncbi:MAG: AAA family ATPase [Eubacterium sp.]|nr:AAA family ATPase [Eubacterium sp.]
MRIAVYGKGGIGKSTISANLSAALAAAGEKVLQIGCDPKHDSTRLLHHGQKVTTVLDYILNTPADDQKPEDILMNGFMGCGCIEAGGPRPGKGCAGRGILTSFEFLNKHNVFSGYSTVVYDVLGDVVCGGFAVPVRKQYAEAVFLVTSGEAMSVYAANNILHGIRNLDPDGKRIAGIIYNSRGAGDEKERVLAFADAVGLPVCLSIPRSSAFLQAEKNACTLVEEDKDLPESMLFLAFAEKLIKGIPLYPASPLGEEEMELFMRGRLTVHPASETEKNDDGCGIVPVPEAAAGVSDGYRIPQKRALSDPFSRIPLFGCAFRGAVDLAVHVKDAAVLAHAPKSCTWYAVNGLSSYGRRGLFDRGILYPAFIPQRFSATDIDVKDAVFGGVEHARQKAFELAKRGVKTIIAVTACIPGLSGDDLQPVKEELRQHGIQMYIVHTDGVEAGDYNEGMALCYKTLAKEAVGPADSPDPDSINIVYEQTFSSDADENYAAVENILSLLGIRVNCRFLCAASVKDIKGFLNAPYSILARKDRLGLELKKIFEDNYGCKFTEDEFPEGFGRTADFAEKLGKLYAKEERAAELVRESRRRYDEELSGLRRVFSGMRTMIFLSRKYAWLEELVKDLGLDVIGASIPGTSEALNAEWNHRFSRQWETDRDAFARTVSELKPALILTGDPSVIPDPPEGCTVIPVKRTIRKGFFSAVQEARKWTDYLGRQLKGRWRDDRPVFEKYYT